MVVRLGVAGELELTDHEAHAVARLLDASGAAAGRALAGRLDPRTSSGAVELDEEEKRALRAALAALRRESLPDNLAALERALDDELARVAPAPVEAYPHDQ